MPTLLLTGRSCSVGSLKYHLNKAKLNLLGGGETMKEISRRGFLKKTGKIALAGAAAFGLESGFLGGSIKLAYGEEPQAGFNVYNDVNPHIKSIQSHTFKECISQGYKPAICYSTSKPMVAVAKGTVVEIIDLQDPRYLWLGTYPKEAKGLAVRIQHGNNYSSWYLHLRQPEVKFGQKIERGQRIGFPDERWNIPSLMLPERINAIDPDNYGINHSFMTYWDGLTNLDIDKEEQNKRIENQRRILQEIAGLCSGSEKYTLLMMKHKRGDRVLKWSAIETFRYMEHLYKKNPQKFSSLTKDQLEKMKKEFYDNQPIILTLPFKKG